MRIKTYLASTLTSTIVVLLGMLLGANRDAYAGDKKPLERGMLEKMEAVPCGAKQKGITGVGSVFASAGVTHVNSDEKLCPQYLLRTDQMEYHIRPMDGKHAVILPVGHEGEFKIKKDHLYLRIPDGDKKERAYQVVSIQQLNSGQSLNPALATGDDAANAANRNSDRSADRSLDSRAPEKTTDPSADSQPLPKPPDANRTAGQTPPNQYPPNW